MSASLKPAHFSAQSPGDNLRQELPPLDGKWQAIVDQLHHALQPIVHLQSGNTYGVEALMRGTAQAGFESIEACIEAVEKDGFSKSFDLAMRHKAIEKYAQIPFADSIKLFCNVDNRIYGDGDHLIGHSLEVLENLNLSPESVCLELSESTDITSLAELTDIIQSHRKAGMRMAIDDFGTGFAGLSMLFKSEPDFVKIDKLFIKDIAHDLRKRIFATNIINLSRNLGISVIAEGIETAGDLATCRDIGCDFGQGYFLSKPVEDIAAIKPNYATDAASTGLVQSRQRLVSSVIEKTQVIEPVRQTDRLNDVLQRFHASDSIGLVPVIDGYSEPVGLLREADLKDLLYNPFGTSLLNNHGISNTVQEVMRKCPVVDVSANPDNFIDNYLSAGGDEGIIVSDNRRYRGFLTSRALLQVTAESHLAAARDQNPLSQLPGNAAIEAFMLKAIGKRDNPHAMAYLDFDHFKAFNDVYGFQRGDRAILMFAEQLKALTLNADVFVGHIGGDDFFLGVSGEPVFETPAYLETLRTDFAKRVESLYDEVHRARGGIYTADRYGNGREFPFMSVSIGAMMLPPGAAVKDVTVLTSAISAAKATAKKNQIGICWSAKYPYSDVRPVQDLIEKIEDSF